MLLRVALEYGQTWCAAATSSCTCALSRPGTLRDIVAERLRPPESRPWPSVRFTPSLAASIFFCAERSDTARLLHVALAISDSCSGFTPSPGPLRALSCSL